ncbi:MAG: TetR family transcriptional regulator [Sediminicola sp.]
MGRKNLSEIRREEIIKSFYRVAKKIGLENTSIAKVAEEMGISNGLVMHYFKTRDELLIGLNEYLLERHLSIVSSREYGVMDSTDNLEKFLESLFSRKWNRYFDDGVFYSCYALVYRKPEFKDSFKKYLDSLHQVLNEKLHEAYNNGLIANDRLDEATEIIFALIDGGYYYLGLFEGKGTQYSQQVNLYVGYAMKLLRPIS